MPDDTKALSEGFFSYSEFFEQAKIAGDEILQQYRRVLEEFDPGYRSSRTKTHHENRPTPVCTAGEPRRRAYSPLRPKPYARLRDQSTLL